MIKFLNWLLPHKEIVNCYGQLYLRRWYLLRTRWFSVFLHKFERSDEDRALHDHPWAFIAIPIWRGYIEHFDAQHVYWQQVDTLDETVETYTQRRRVRPIIGARYHPATFQHRVELLPCDYQGEMTGTEDDCPRCHGNGELPAWSIFIHFKREREWGFDLPEGWISQKQWWSENCE